MLLETFVSKQLDWKAHRVMLVKFATEQVVVEIDRLKSRALRCGRCRGACRKIHQVEEARSWRDLPLRQLPIVLRYRPRRLRWARCGVHGEALPWA